VPNGAILCEAARFGDCSSVDSRWVFVDFGFGGVTWVLGLEDHVSLSSCCLDHSDRLGIGDRSLTRF
jgi:hypothetical protein